MADGNSPPTFPAVRGTDLGAQDPNFLFDTMTEMEDQMADLVADDEISDVLLESLEDDGVMRAIEPRDQWEALALAGGMPEPLGVTPVIGGAPTGPRISEFVNRGMTRFMQGRANQASARIEARVKHAEREQQLAQEVLQDMSSTRRTAKLEVLRTMLNKSGRGSIADALPMLFKGLEINKETGTAIAGMYGIADDPLVQSMIQSYEPRGGAKGPMRTVVVESGPMKGTYRVPEGVAYDKAITLMRDDLKDRDASVRRKYDDWLPSTRTGFLRDVEVARMTASMMYQSSMAGAREGRADTGVAIEEFQDMGIPSIAREFEESQRQAVKKWDRIDQERKASQRGETLPEVELPDVEYPLGPFAPGGGKPGKKATTKKSTKKAPPPTASDPLGLRGYFSDDADR